MEIMEKTYTEKQINELHKKMIRKKELQKKSRARYREKYREEINRKQREKYWEDKDKRREYHKKYMRKLRAKKTNEFLKRKRWKIDFKRVITEWIEGRYINEDIFTEKDLFYIKLMNEKINKEIIL